MKSAIANRLAYLHLTLTHSKYERSRTFAIRLRKILKVRHAAFRRMSASKLPFLFNVSMKAESIYENGVFCFFH